MKGKVLVSIVAIAIIIVAAVLLLLEVDNFKDLSSTEWLIILIILGVLVGVIALIVNSLPKIEKKEDVYSQFKMGYPISSNQNITEKEKALNDLESGIINYGEYEDRLKKIQEDAEDLKKRKDYVNNSLSKLNDLLLAGILTAQEFSDEATRICNENNIQVPRQYLEKCKQDAICDDSRAGRIVKLMELKEEGKLTEEEYEKRMSKL
jgi:hypothetical protein